MKLEFFDFPLAFWQEVLGEELHYHMGHFLSPDGTDETLGEAMERATDNLLNLLPTRTISRILDVGCGWGGPAFQLAKTLRCEVVGIVFNQTQADYINAKAMAIGQPIYATRADAEESDLALLGRFDLAWVDESLDHMAKRDVVLAGLRKVTKLLALAIHCRNACVPKDNLYNEFFGIPSCESKEELLALLTQTGWKTLTVTDRTSLVLPSFTKWQENLKRARRLYPIEADTLLKAHQATEKLYQQGLLYSIQLVAEGG